MVQWWSTAWNECDPLCQNECSQAKPSKNNTPTASIALPASRNSIRVILLVYVWGGGRERLWRKLESEITVMVGVGNESNDEGDAVAAWHVVDELAF